MDLLTAIENYTGEEVREAVLIALLGDASYGPTVERTYAYEKIQVACRFSDKELMFGMLDIQRQRTALEYLTARFGEPRITHRSIE